MAYTLRVNRKKLNTLNGKKIRNLIYNGITYQIAQNEVTEGCLTFSSERPFTLTINTIAEYNNSLQYSTNNSTWTEVTKGTAISSVNNKLYLRGSGNTYCRGTSSSKKTLTLNGFDIKCSGNIETLLDYQTVLNGEHPTMDKKCYYCLFNHCSSLIQAPELPAITLNNECYKYMFYSCSGLLETPELPATTLAEDCYYNMFTYCTNLIKISALPATILYDDCYNSMFSSCSNLKQLPLLPATALKQNCYFAMFNSCSSIKISTTQTEECPNAYRIPSGNATGTTKYNSIAYMFAYTNGGAFLDEIEINATYYTNCEIIGG